MLRDAPKLADLSRTIGMAQLSIHMHKISYYCGEACSRGEVGGQDGEVEPSQVAVEVSGSDAPEAAEETLALTVAAVHRLNVQRATHPFAGRRVERLVAHAERGRARGIRAMGVGEGCLSRLRVRARSAGRRR